MTVFNIRKLNVTDISKVVDIHQSSLPEDFLPSLGRSFLIKIFYPAITASQNAETFVAYHEESVVGFIVISLKSSKLLREIVFYRFFSFLAILIKSSLSSLKQFKNIISILCSSFYSSDENDLGEIYIIAVDKAHRGCGIGKMLVNKSIEYLKEHKVPGIKIKTLKTNCQWISFFMNSNWKISAEFKIADKDYVVLFNRFQKLSSQDTNKKKIIE